MNGGLPVSYNKAVRRDSMSEKRRDNRNRILREGEYQRSDGRYRFRYIDEDGKENEKV